MRGAHFRYPMALGCQTAAALSASERRHRARFRSRARAAGTALDGSDDTRTAFCACDRRQDEAVCATRRCQHEMSAQRTCTQLARLTAPARTPTDARHASGSGMRTLRLGCARAVVSSAILRRKNNGVMRGGRTGHRARKRQGTAIPSSGMQLACSAQNSPLCGIASSRIGVHGSGVAPQDSLATAAAMSGWMEERHRPLQADPHCAAASSPLCSSAVPRTAWWIARGFAGH